MRNLRIELWIPGTPVPKGRPRFRKNGSTYTPQKTVDYERLVKQSAGPQLMKYGNLPSSLPARVDFEFHMPIPKSWPKKKKANPPRHTSRPDKDNLEKAIGDALNDILWADDSQIYSGNTSKVYSETPGVKIICEFDVDNSST